MTRKRTVSLHTLAPENRDSCAEIELISVENQYLSPVISAIDLNKG
jgi:hypothetical protein